MRFAALVANIAWLLSIARNAYMINIVVGWTAINWLLLIDRAAAQVAEQSNRKVLTLNRYLRLQIDSLSLAGLLVFDFRAVAAGIGKVVVVVAVILLLLVFVVIVVTWSSCCRPSRGASSPFFQHNLDMICSTNMLRTSRLCASTKSLEINAIIIAE